VTSNRPTNDEPLADPQVIEAIEAYRPGRDDSSEPALARLVACLAAQPALAQKHERLQKLDAVLTQVFRDVPVPEGLQQRILDRLAAVGRIDAEETAAGHRSTRRRWLAWASTAVVAASVLVGAFFTFRPAADLTEGEILEVAATLFDRPVAEPGRLLADSFPLPEVVEKFPLGSDVAAPADTRWREIRDFLGRDGVAYEMTGWGGARATLYVVRHDRESSELGISPPGSPTRTTGGRAAAAWQADGLLYVLVVQGDAATYRGFLNPSRPLT
jgi:hypothetical protein